MTKVFLLPQALEKIWIRSNNYNSNAIYVGVECPNAKDERIPSIFLDQLFTAIAGVTPEGAMERVYTNFIKVEVLVPFDQKAVGNGLVSYFQLFPLFFHQLHEI